MLYNLLESPDYNVLGCFCKYSYKCIFLVFTVFIFWQNQFMAVFAHRFPCLFNKKTASCMCCTTVT